MLMNLACEICDKRIEHNEDVVYLQVGKRNKGIIPRYLRVDGKHSKGIAVAHIKCLELEYDSDYPEAAAAKACKAIKENGGDR